MWTPSEACKSKHCLGNYELWTVLYYRVLIGVRAATMLLGLSAASGIAYWGPHFNRSLLSGPRRQLLSSGAACGSDSAYVLPRVEAASVHSLSCTSNQPCRVRSTQLRRQGVHQKVAAVWAEARRDLAGPLAVAEAEAAASSASASSAA